MIHHLDPAQTDAVTILGQLDQRLRAKKDPVTVASLPFEDFADDGEGRRKSRRLVYGRLGGTYQLHFEEQTYLDDGEEHEDLGESSHPLSELDHEGLQLAILQIDPLLKSYAEATTTMNGKTRAAAESAKAMMAQI